MDLQTILTVKQPAFEAILRSLRLYMESDECVCDGRADVPPLLRSLDAQPCPPDCEDCTWCLGRKALRGIGQQVDA